MPVTLLILSFLTGMAIIVFLNHSVISIKLRESIEHRYIALISLMGAAYILLTIIEYLLTDSNLYIIFIKIQMISVYLFFVFLLLLILRFTGSKCSYAMKIYIFLFLVFIGARLLHPTSLVFSEPMSMQTLVLPWGEQLNLINSKGTYWMYLYLALLFIAYAIGITLLVKYIKETKAVKIYGLIVSMAAFFMLNIADVFISYYAVPFFYVSEFGYVIVSFVISVYFTSEVIESSLTRKRYNEELSSAMEELEAQNDTLAEALDNVESSEKRYRELADLLPQTVFEVDLNKKLLYSNMEGKRLTGYNDQDLENGLDIMTMFLKEEHPRIIQNLGRLLETGVTVPGEYTLIRKTGELVPVMVYTKVIYDNDRPLSLMGIMIDITEQKKTRDLLVQSEKMTTVAGLAAGLAHEINNPLAIILQGLHVVKRKLDPDREKNIQKAHEMGLSMNDVVQFLHACEITSYMDGIEKAALRSSEIIKSMLNFSRQKGSISVETDINSLVEDSLEMASRDYNLTTHYDFRHIKIIRKLGENLKVECVPGEIQQVLFNLFINAAQAMFGVTDTPEIEISTFIMQEDVVIKVYDNGPGICREDCSRIFDPFYTTKPPGEGTGLGLAVSYYIIVDNHQGSIQVECPEEGGTLFTITLPLRSTSSV